MAMENADELARAVAMLDEVFMAKARAKTVQQEGLRTQTAAERRMEVCGHEM